MSGQESMAKFTEQLQQSMLPHIRGLDVYEGVEPVEVMAERAGIPAGKNHPAQRQ